MVRATSYINNLHPNYHQELYAIIEQVVARAIPLWNRTLSRPTFPSPRVELPQGSWGYAEHPDEPELIDGENDDEYDNRYQAWSESRIVVQPEPGDFKPPAEAPDDHDGHTAETSQVEPLVDLRKQFGKLQIIVKLANIHLTPEKPSYAGGSWHVEGQANESMYVLPVPLNLSSVPPPYMNLAAKWQQMRYGAVLLRL